MKMHGIYAEIKAQRSLERWQQQGVEACIVTQVRTADMAAVIWEPGNATRYSIIVTRVPAGKPDKYGLTVPDHMGCKYVAMITNFGRDVVYGNDHVMAFPSMFFSVAPSPNQIVGQMLLNPADAVALAHLFEHLLETWQKEK